MNRALRTPTVVIAVAALAFLIGVPGLCHGADPRRGEDRSRQLLAEGLKLEKDRDFAGAVKKYEEGYRQAPKKIEFLVLIGEANTRQGKLSEALDSYEMYRRELDLVHERNSSFSSEPHRPPARVESLRKQHEVAVEQTPAERTRLLNILSADYRDLDRAIAEQRLKQGANTQFLLLQARTKLYLEQWADSLDFLDRYQTHDPKPVDARLHESYEKLASVFAEQLKKEEEARPTKPPRTLLLLARVQVGLFRLEGQGNLAMGLIEGAVTYYDAYRHPDKRYATPDPEFLKGLPPKSDAEEKFYLALVQMLEKEHQKTPDLPTLKLLLGRADHMAGQPKKAVPLLEGLAATLEPNYYERHSLWEKEAKGALPVPVWKRWYFWVGIGAGVAVLVGSAAGIAVAKTQDDTGGVEFMNYSLRGGRR